MDCEKVKVEREMSTAYAVSSICQELSHLRPPSSPLSHAAFDYVSLYTLPLDLEDTMYVLHGHNL